MRLIDADVLNNFIDKWLSKKCDEHGNTTPNEWLNSLKRCVEEQPTAYDIDNVIEELEKEKTICFLTDANTGNEVSDLVYRRVYSALDKAIEIVKNGGVADDVCEWQSASDGEFIQNPHTKRLYSNEPSMKNIYCNTCGKKIKVVE